MKKPALSVGFFVDDKLSESYLTIFRDALSFATM